MMRLLLELDIICHIYWRNYKTLIISIGGKVEENSPSSTPCIENR